VHAAVGFLAEPLLGELVEMGPALEGPVADEEVLLDVPDVALALALGLGARPATGPRAEANAPCSSPSILSLLPMAIGEGTFSLMVGDFLFRCSPDFYHRR
jgi:hypothetical protein